MNVCAASARCRSELVAAGLLAQLLSAITVAHAAAPAPAPTRQQNYAGDSAAAALSANAIGELEVRKNSLGALNNLLLDDEAAQAFRGAGGIETLIGLLREAGPGEARVEDAASSLLRVLQEDVKAGDVLVRCGGLPVLVATLSSPNEELQVYDGRGRASTPLTHHVASAHQALNSTPYHRPHKPSFSPSLSPSSLCVALVRRFASATSSLPQ